MESGRCPETNDAIQIEAVAVVDGEIMEGMKRLVPQLSSSAAVPTADELRAIVASPCTTLLLARDRSQSDRIIGSLTLAVFRVPTGVRAWIEDVVVDATARGKGAGEALSHEALRLARAQGARTVDLTSRPSREAANRLYTDFSFGRPTSTAVSSTPVNPIGARARCPRSDLLALECRRFRQQEVTNAQSSCVVRRDPDVAGSGSSRRARHRSRVPAQEARILVGKWTTTGEMKATPMGPAGKLSMTDTCEWFRRLYRAVPLSGNRTRGTHQASGSWATAPIRRCTVYGMDNTAMAMTTVAKGTVQGDTWTYLDEGTMGGAYKSRVVLKIASPASYKFTWELLGPDKKWMPI